MLFQFRQKKGSSYKKLLLQNRIRCTVLYERQKKGVVQQERDKKEHHKRKILQEHFTAFMPPSNNINTKNGNRNWITKKKSP